MPVDVSLYRLHCVIQSAMGWAEQGDFLFRSGERVYALSRVARLISGRVHDCRKTNLDQLDLSPKNPVLTYVYDFEDHWTHEITVLKLSNGLAQEARKVVCLQARRACPPEKSGGIETYCQTVLPILANKGHRLHNTYRAWAGVDFNPAEADLESINRELEGVLTRRRIADSV